jgi:hypothetical protein
MVGKFVADFFSPCTMPTLDGALRLAVSGGGMDHVDPELATDRAERARDVGRSQIDVVRARASTLENRLLEAVLVLDRRLAEREVAVREIPGRHIDLTEEVGLSDLAIGGDHEWAVQGITHPEIPGMFDQERSPFRRRSTLRSSRDPVRREEPMHRGSVQLSRADHPRTLEHPYEPAQRSPRLLPFRPHEKIGYRR